MFNTSSGSLQYHIGLNAVSMAMYGGVTDAGWAYFKSSHTPNGPIEIRDIYGTHKRKKELSVAYRAPQKGKGMDKRKGQCTLPNSRQGWWTDAQWAPHVLTGNPHATHAKDMGRGRRNVQRFTCGTFGHVGRECQQHPQGGAVVCHAEDPNSEWLEC